MYHERGPTFRELVEQALSSTVRGYDLLAPKFDVTPFRTPDVVVERSLADLGEVESAVDLCCGTGAGLAGLATRVRRRLVGVDFSAGMLAIAKERCATSAVTPELVEADVFTYASSTPFDLVTCYGALGHIPEADEGRFLALVRSLLADGGRFVFVTTREASAFSARYLVGKAFNGVMRLRNALLQPPFIMYYLTFELPKIERLLRFHGFDVAVTDGLFDAPYGELVRVVATRR